MHASARARKREFDSPVPRQLLAGALHRVGIAQLHRGERKLQIGALQGPAQAQRITRRQRKSDGAVENRLRRLFPELHRRDCTATAAWDKLPPARASRSSLALPRNPDRR